VENYWTQRRKHMRVECRVPIEVIEPVRTKMETINLSLGGAFCSSPVRMPRGVQLTCIIRARDHKTVRQDLQVNALIRRSQVKENGESRHMVALEFVEFPVIAQSTLKKFLETLAGVDL